MPACPSCLLQACARIDNASRPCRKPAHQPTAPHACVCALQASEHDPKELLSRNAACRLVNTNITVLLVHPGIAATSLNLFMPGPINQLYASLSKGWTLTVPQVCPPACFDSCS